MVSMGPLLRELCWGVTLPDTFLEGGDPCAAPLTMLRRYPGAQRDVSVIAHGLRHAETAES